MLFIKLTCYENYFIKDFIKFYDFVTIDEGENYLEGYYNVKFTDEGKTTKNHIFSISHSFPFYYYNSIFTFISPNNFYSTNKSIDTKIYCELFEKYYNTFKHETKFLPNYLDYVKNELTNADAIDLLKSNILMCKVVHEYMQRLLYYAYDIYEIFGNLRRVYLFKNRPNECVFKLSINKFIIKPINSIIFHILLHSINGKFTYKINLSEFINLVKSMNLNVNAYFNYYDDYQLVKLNDDIQNNLILNNLSEPKLETIIKFNEYMDYAFGENKELILTYFAYSIRHIHKNEFKILNISNVGYHFHFIELIHKLISKMYTFGELFN